jgi:hypothetical protein
MSSVNDSLNHFIALDAISGGMKSVGRIAKVTKLDKVIAEKKGFSGGKKERNDG